MFTLFLVAESIPASEAQLISRAIERWDSFKIPANPLQVPIFIRHHEAIKRAGLWRNGILLNS